MGASQVFCGRPFIDLYNHEIRQQRTSGRDVATRANNVLVVEFAALAEHAPGELTPDYVDERFSSMHCRDPGDKKNKNLLKFEKQAKEMEKWLKEVFEGKHDGEIYDFEIIPWKAGSFDEEIVSIKVYVKADNSRIVDGKVHIVLED
jgi:hypothetical protein